MSHRIYSLISESALVVALATSASAQTGTFVPPADKVARIGEPLPATANAKTASAAANAARSIASWLNKLANSQLIDISIKNKNKFIHDILASTGQPGILFRVDIQKTEGETPVYTVVSDGIQYVGAGTTPVAVNSAINQQVQIRPAPSLGSVIDYDQSHFIWFSKSSSQIEATVIPARMIISETARRYADQKLADALNSNESIVALDLAVKYTEDTIKDKITLEKLKNLRKNQESTNRQTKIIMTELSSQIERAKAAQRAGASLALLSNVLTLGSQIANLSIELGKDMPAEAYNAKSNNQLKDIVSKLESEANSNVHELQIKYGVLTSKSTGITTEFLNILRTTKYPVDSVPQLKLPPSP